MTTSRGMVPADIARLVDVGEPRLSPDATLVAFVVTTVDLDANRYRSRVWLAATNGSTPPRPFTSGEQRDGSPRWSPDGRWLAVVSSSDSGEATIRTLPLGGGETVTVATRAEAVEALAWSPDGTRLGFVSRQAGEGAGRDVEDRDRPPRRIDRFGYRLDGTGWTIDRPRHLFVVPSDGSEPPQAATAGPFQHDGVAWSPDGSRLAFAAGRHETRDRDQAVDLFTVGLPGPDGPGQPEQLTLTGQSWTRPSFSPDGQQIAFVWGDPGSIPRHPQVGVLDTVGGEPPRLLTTDLDRHCAPFFSAREPVWVGDDLLLAVEDAGNVHLYRVPAAGTERPEQLIGGDRQVTGFDHVAGTTAFTATDPTALPELYISRDGREQQLTDFGRRLADHVELVAPQRFTAISTGDAEVEAWIIPPVGVEVNQRYPVLVNIHGGPFTQYGNRLFDEFQVQAGAGYAVLYCNPRGSSGYDEAWGRAIRGPNAAEDPGSGWGGVDADDVLAVLDTALERFAFCDPERIGVLGGSYGGYLTSWLIGHTDRFQAACSERALNNMLTFAGTSDIGAYFPACYVGATHLEDPEEFLRQSPTSYVDAITTPLLILHSDGDLRCPAEQAEQLFVALRLLGHDVEYVRFPGEGHELSRSGAPRHRVQRLDLILDYFARHLSPSTIVL